MKLSILPSEAKEGHKRGRFGKKWDDIKLLAINKQPVSLTRSVRIEDTDDECWIVRLRETKEDANGQHISFDPIYARGYRICHLRSTKSKAIVVETEKQQVMIDDEGIHDCKFTLRGPGVDPSISEKAGKLLADIVADPLHSNLQRQVREYLSKL